MGISFNRKVEKPTFSSLQDESERTSTSKATLKKRKTNTAKTKRSQPTAQKNAARRPNTRHCIYTYEILSEDCMAEQVNTLVSSIENGKTAVTIYMGKRGDTTLGQLRAVKAVKLALENPKAVNHKKDVLNQIEVKYHKNPYAGEFYRNIIRDVDILGADIKTTR